MTYFIHSIFICFAVFNIYLPRRGAVIRSANIVMPKAALGQSQVRAVYRKCAAAVERAAKETERGI